MEGIFVNASGAVHVGQNIWVSLEKIQQAVLHATNPGLHESLTTAEGKMQTVNTSKRKQTANIKQEALPLPSTIVRNEQPKAGCGCKQTKHTANDDGEHLPLPTTRDAIFERREKNLNSGEHLELPTTYRTK